MASATFLIGLLVILLHEAAHLVAARAFGIHIKRIGVSWKGVYIVRECGTPLGNMVTTLAGPLVNLLLAAAWPVSHRFAVVNLIFGVVNLVPFAGSDGQRAVTQLLGLGYFSGWSYAPVRRTQMLRYRTGAP
jgi:Zn-dependent protease